MSRELREVAADWLMVIGALLLLIALFLPWSHAVRGEYSSAFAGTGALAGVDRDPDAWQVYSVADLLLLAVAIYVAVMALIGPRRPRILGLVGVLGALAFVVHAADVPPTNGIGAATPAQGIAAPPDHPDSGAGETTALLALVLCGGGLLLSLTADPPPPLP